MDDDYDTVPKVGEASPKYAYLSKRCSQKEARQKALPGRTYWKCAEFYKTSDNNLNKCSRHRYKSTKNPLLHRECGIRCFLTQTPVTK